MHYFQLFNQFPKMKPKIGASCISHFKFKIKELLFILEKTESTVYNVVD